MNKDSYAGLPEDLHEILKEACGGEAAVENVSAKFEQITEDAKAIIADMGGEVYTLPDAERAKLKDAADVTWETWISDMETDGYPAQDLVDEL